MAPEMQALQGFKTLMRCTLNPVRGAAENPEMQARLAREALGGVLLALRLHRDRHDVAAKALVLLGLLGQVRPAGSRV